MNHSPTPIPSFDESTYLALNPDISATVQKGNFSSGWEHYLIHGIEENRPGVPPGLHQAMQSLMGLSAAEPAPPEHLRKRVHGAEDRDSFERIGRVVSFNISDAFQSKLSADAAPRILDFGCGCGRIIRYFSKLTTNAAFYGTDIDAEAISWCQQNLAHLGQFLTNDPHPPLPFDDNFFDFIFSISIFTHLPEEMELAWLEELRRVTKPGGTILLTTHGEELFPAFMPEALQSQFREKGFHYLVGENTDGLPSFYQTSYHTDTYIQNRWGKFFEIEQIIKKGIARNQDLILCRK